MLLVGCDTGTPLESVPVVAPTAAPMVPSPGDASSLTPEQVRAGIERLVGNQMTSIGFGIEQIVHVGLRADGEDLARQIHATYGDAVEITVGMFPYPPPAQAERGCRNFAEVTRDHAPLTASVAVDGEVRAGSFYRGTVRLTNASPGAYQLLTSSSFSLFLFRPGEAHPIGVSEGITMGTGFGRELLPGESIDFEAGGGTASCDLALGYMLPLGRYDVRALIDFQPSRAEEGAYFWSEPATIDVVGQ